MRISDWSSDVCSSDLLISHIAIEPTLVEECRLCRIGGIGKGGVNVGLDRPPSRQGRQIVDPEETRLDGFETRFGNGVISPVAQEKPFVKDADFGGIALTGLDQKSVV